MAGRVLRHLDDVIRVGMYVEVTCNGCGRRAMFGASTLRDYARSLRVTTELRGLGERMVCHNFGQGCGHRGATLLAIDWPPAAAAPNVPKDLGIRLARMRDEKKARERH